MGSKELIHHTPGGGDKPIVTEKLSFRETAAPKVNMRTLGHEDEEGERTKKGTRPLGKEQPVTMLTHLPLFCGWEEFADGQEALLLTLPKPFTRAPQVGSLANIQHTPGGGKVKIVSEKLNFRETASPKVDARLARTSISSTKSDDKAEAEAPAAPEEPPAQ